MARAASLRPPGVRRAAAAGSAVSGLAGARLHCCEPGGWRAHGRDPGDLAGRKTRSVLDEETLPGFVKAAIRTHAEMRSWNGACNKAAAPPFGHEPRDLSLGGPGRAGPPLRRGFLTSALTFLPPRKVRRLGRM